MLWVEISPADVFSHFRLPDCAIGRSNLSAAKKKSVKVQSIIGKFYSWSTVTFKRDLQAFLMSDMYLVLNLQFFQSLYLKAFRTFLIANETTEDYR